GRAAAPRGGGGHAGGRRRHVPGAGRARPADREGHRLRAHARRHGGEPRSPAVRRSAHQERGMTRRHGFVAGLLLRAASPAWPQSYDVRWWSIDGGGAMGRTGGPYVLDSTSGQPDAGGPSVGGAYVLHSGFWAVAPAGR